MEYAASCLIDDDCNCTNRGHEGNYWLFSSGGQKQLIEGEVLINKLASEYKDLGGEWKQ